MLTIHGRAIDSISTDARDGNRESSRFPNQETRKLGPLLNVAQYRSPGEAPPSSREVPAGTRIRATGMKRFAGESADIKWGSAEC